MELMTDRVVFYYIFFASMIILVTMLWGLTKYKKLTNFQKNNRNNFVIKQGIILVIFVAIFMGINYILTLVYQNIQNNITQTESVFKFQVLQLAHLLALIFCCKKN
jgi:predicted neutral ceramidase superfamily lipid hydrolase